MHHFTDPFHKTQNATGKFTKRWYSIRSVHADKVLDIAQSGPLKDNLMIYKGWAGDNQCFKVVQEGDYYVLVCKKDSVEGQKEVCLTVGGDADNARISLTPRAKPAAPGQRFRIESSGSHAKDYFIYTFCGKVLDVFEQKKDDGTKVIQYKLQQGQKKNQLWNFCDPKDVTSSSDDND